MPADAPQLPTRRRRNGRGRAALSRQKRADIITRAHLDGRTRARRQFDAIASEIAADLGGEDQLSTIQKHLVEAFAGVALSVHDLNARLLLGQQIDVGVQAQAVSTMIRAANRIGVRRIAMKDVTPPSVDEYLAHVRGQRQEEKAS
jgi:hypothetical protein